MSVSYYSPVTRHGLVLYLDAANRQSYVSGSSTWLNLISNGISGSMVNSPTYTNEYGGGTLDFESGAQQWVNLGTPSQLLLQVPMTICGFFNPESLPSYSTIYSAYDDVSASKLWNLIRIDSGNLISYVSRNDGSIQYFNPNFPLSTNTWYFFGYVMNGSVSSATATYYLNDTQVVSHTFPTALSSTPDATVLRRIGRTWVASEFFDGKIGMLQVYNRALNRDELMRNFYRFKTRYGM